ncbi:MAG: hypothetical protein JWN89_434 [Parcubacteria group bacterium]|nr:hypothetical protein [Parcubacteria group bacterium]
MKALQNNKGMLTFAAALLLGWGVYKMFFAGDPSLDVPVTEVNVGADVLELNASLQSVTLDRTLFSTTAYTSLVDFSTVLPVQPQGRINPFAPIGSDF